MDHFECRTDPLTTFKTVDEAKQHYGCLYSFKIFMLYVEFKNTKSKTEICPGFWLSTNSLDGFLYEIWEVAQHQVKREVIFDNVNHTESFSAKEIPDIADIATFLKLHETVAHSYFNFDIIEESHLDDWSDGRRLEVYVFPYGVNVVKKAQWDKLHNGKNALIPSVNKNKAGAATDEEVDAMKEELKSIHGHRYTACDVSWGAWADWILKKKVEEHARLKVRAPPYKLFDVFRAVPLEGEVILGAVAEDTTIAESVASGFSLDIDAIITHFEGIMAISKAKRVAEKENERIHLEKLKALKAKLEGTKSTLNAVGRNTRPVENLLSEEYLENMGDQEDIDHIEEEHLDDE